MSSPLPGPQSPSQVMTLATVAIVVVIAVARVLVIVSGHHDDAVFDAAFTSGVALFGIAVGSHVASK